MAVVNNYLTCITSFATNNAPSIVSPIAIGGFVRPCSTWAIIAPETIEIN